MLKFSPGSGNAKLQLLGGKVFTFSLPSGWACPGAEECYAKAVVGTDNKKSVQDGPKMEFRCFSATQEALYSAVYEQRKYNFDLIKETMKKNPAHKATALAQLIENSLPPKATVIRVHVAGDFFDINYMKAWFLVAQNYPSITFYAYTKSVHFWVELMGSVPGNFKMNASRGGKYDHLIDLHNLKSAEVVYTEQEAADKGLDIDHDDAHAFLQDKSFALLLHGVQPRGSEAAEALKLLKKANIGQYTKTKKDGTKIKKSKKPAKEAVAA